jgi:hypothetical protein
VTIASRDEQRARATAAGAPRSRAPLARAVAAAAVIAALAAVGCAGPPPPPAQDTSTLVISPPTSTLAPSASAAPPAPPSASAPALPPPASPSQASAVPSAAPSVNRETCRSQGPAVTFEVKDDDHVVALDAQGCPLGGSSFKPEGYSYQASVDFMTELQRRLEANDKNGLAELVNYPLRVNRSKGGPLIVKDRAAFLRSFDQIYTPGAVSTILSKDPRDVACNYQGVMLEHGVLWMDNSKGGHYGVIAINVH